MSDDPTGTTPVPSDPTGHWAGKRPSDTIPHLFFAKGDEWADWLCEQGVPGDFHTLLAASIDDARAAAATMQVASMPLRMPRV